VLSYHTRIGTLPTDGPRICIPTTTGGQNVCSKSSSSTGEILQRHQEEELSLHREKVRKLCSVLQVHNRPRPLRGCGNPRLFLTVLSGRI